MVLITESIAIQSFIEKNGSFVDVRGHVWLLVLLKQHSSLNAWSYHLMWAKLTTVCTVHVTLNVTVVRTIEYMQIYRPSSSSHNLRSLSLAALTSTCLPGHTKISERELYLYPLWPPHMWWKHTCPWHRLPSTPCCTVCAVDIHNLVMVTPVLFLPLAHLACLKKIGTRLPTVQYPLPLSLLLLHSVLG